MKRPLLSSLVVALLALAPLSQVLAQAAAKQPVAQQPAASAQPGAESYLKVVGNPPAANSEVAKADLAIILWEQQRRTPEDIRRAKSEEKLTLAAFADAAGRELDPARFPKTLSLIEKATADVKKVTDVLKKKFERPRPFVAKPEQVKPAIALEPSASFPSGHATRGVFFAAILAQLAPEKSAELAARGLMIGIDRVIGGVHWPSDVEAGQRLGRKIADNLLASDEYKKAIEEARAEWAAPAAAAVP